MASKRQRSSAQIGLPKERKMKSEKQKKKGHDFSANGEEEELSEE